VKQQINLYQPIFRKQKIVFSAGTLLWLSIGFLVLLLAWSQLINQRVSHLEAEYERQLAAEQRAAGQLGELQRTLPPDEPDPQLEALVLQLEQQRDELQQTLSALQTRMPVSETDIGPRLDALADRVPHGLWLTGISLDKNGDGITLRGRALSPRLVPEFVGALADSPLFAGTAFRTVRVTASDDGQPGVQFVLSTATEESP
jgi:Tfp pilus assembly protein PilN